MSTSSAVARRPSRPLSLPRWVNLPGIAFLVLLVAVWQLVVGTGTVHFTYLPSPAQIWTAGTHLFSSGAVSRDVGHTLVATLIGWALGTAIGMALGLALGLYNRLWRNTAATFEVLRALPSIAFVPIAVLILGFSTKMEVIIAAYVAIWPVFLNTLNGVQDVSAAHHDVSRVMRMSKLAEIRKIVLPSATGNIIVGVRLSMALSLALAVVAEMVGNPAGVGNALVVEEQALQPARMFVYVVLIGILGILLNACLLMLARVLFRGPVSATGEGGI